MGSDGYGGSPLPDGIGQGSVGNAPESVLMGGDSLVWGTWPTLTLSLALCPLPPCSCWWLTERSVCAL